MDESGGMFLSKFKSLKNKKNFLCRNSTREKLKLFWGEQQAVVTLVAAACNFYRG
jgi:hypothetical protein